jgi:hypothetical protein
VNDKLGRIWKESVVAKFKQLFQHFLGGTEKNYEILCEDSRSPERDLKPTPQEYETGV